MRYLPRPSALLSVLVLSAIAALPAKPVIALGSTATVDPDLEAYFAAQLPGTTSPAVITYARRPGEAELDRLRSVGIDRGFALQALPMILADLDAAQLAAVRAQPGVISVWGNQVMEPMTNESRAFIGVPQTMADAEVTRANVQNPGFPISGKGVGIGYLDTGIDGTQADLRFGTKVVQNVNQPLAYGVVSDAGLILGVGVSISDLLAGTGFVPPIFVEDQPTTDLESGHGTHGAGISAGTGQNSGDFYGGVALGAHLVGVNVGDDMGLPLVAILAGFDYLLVHQIDFGIRVINNSWGSRLRPTNVIPEHPINVATREAHDRNIAVVFAAGNAGSAADAINPYSTMPWTISVAAGEKRGFGFPAGFSSRGVDDGTGHDTAGMPADPTLAPNLRPDVTAPGVAVVSVRAHGPNPIMTAISALNGDPTQVPPAFQPNYYSSNGTSFAAPHVSGVVALMLEADPLLTPDEIVTILRTSASPMPFPERVVGAGYVDAHNAVRAALGLAAVDHPANLIPEDGVPEILDARGDQIGTAAQDIVQGRIRFDEAAGQLVYRLTLDDLSVITPEAQWRVSSDFGQTTIFVAAAVLETGEIAFTYGRITILEGGIRNQETLGPADSGAVEGDDLVIRLAAAKINDAVGFDVVGTTSTATSALSQIRIGASFTPALLLTADSASGFDFKVGEDGDGDPDPDPDPDPEPSCDGETVERFAGVLRPGDGQVDVPFTLDCPTLEGHLTFHPGSQEVVFELLDGGGQVIAAGSEANGKRMRLAGLVPGEYSYRVRGAVAKAVDFVVRSTEMP